MALKTFRPTSPEPAPSGADRPQRPVEGRSGQGAGRGQVQDRRPQHRRPHHDAPHRRRSQAVLPAGRLPSPQARRAGHRRAARVRSEPDRVHRADQVRRTARCRYILAPQRLAVGDTVVSGEKVDVKPGNAMPLAVDADRHDRPQRRDEAGPRRPARPFGRLLRAARRPRQRLGGAEAQLRRDPQGPRRVHGHRSARCRTRTTPTGGRQGRPHPLEGHASDRPLDRHEPGRPSERRPHQGRQALGDAVGQADQGLQDPQEQERPTSSSFAAVRPRSNRRARSSRT